MLVMGAVTASITCPKALVVGPQSEADLDVIADQRGERPGKTPNWDAPKQRLELLLRT